MFAPLQNDTFLRACLGLATDHTVVTVTHSMALLSQCNGVMVMDKGRITSAGPARQVLSTLGIAGSKPAPRTEPKEAHAAHA